MVEGRPLITNQPKICFQAFLPLGYNHRVSMGLRPLSAENCPAPDSCLEKSDEGSTCLFKFHGWNRYPSNFPSIRPRLSILPLFLSFFLLFEKYFTIDIFLYSGMDDGRIILKIIVGIKEMFRRDASFQLLCLIYFNYPQIANETKGKFTCRIEIVREYVLIG